MHLNKENTRKLLGDFASATQKTEVRIGNSSLDVYFRDLFHSIQKYLSCHQVQQVQDIEKFLKDFKTRIILL